MSDEQDMSATDATATGATSIEGARDRVDAARERPASGDLDARREQPASDQLHEPLARASSDALEVPRERSSSEACETQDAPPEPTAARPSREPGRPLFSEGDGASIDDALDQLDTDLPDSELLAPGTMISGRFRLGQLIGRGGHGFVYEAEHVVLGYPVAIKVLHAVFGLDARRRARFRREALLGARLRHRNVVSIHDAGELADGSPFLVMEHVDGVDLATVIDRAQLDAAATIEIGVQLLAAVTVLTERGVIHRDIKPNNVMLQRSVDGYVEVKLLDFGISKAMRAELALKTLTADNCVLGTPQYMSPEQVRGEALDVRADLYAVGCLLYECLTGTPPFDAETPGGVLAKILTEDARPLRSLRPDVPQALAHVIERAVHKLPDGRWSHPAEMSEALRAVAQRLVLPRGADAWDGVAYDETSDGGALPLVLANEKRTSSRPPPAAIITPARALETTPERPASRPGKIVSASVPSFLSRVAPRAQRARRWAAVAAVLPIALGVSALTWGASGPESTIASAEGIESRDGLVRVGAPESGDVETEDAALGSVDLFLADDGDGDELVEGLDAPDLGLAHEMLPVREASRRARRGPDPAALEQRALSAYLAGRERESVSVYLRATELAPARASAWRGLGLASASIGDRRTAIHALRRYLALDPGAIDREAIEGKLSRLGS